MTRLINVINGPSGNSKQSSNLIGSDDNCNEINYICDVCGKNFYRKSSLTIHVNSHYLKNKGEADRLQKENQNTCNICNKTFTAKKNLLKHLRRVHKNYKEADQMRIKKLKCPEKDCQYMGRLMKELRDHIQRFHKIKIFRDVLEFHNQEEFQKWKRDEENEAVALFVTGRMKTSLINGCKKQTLHCHRTGQYSPKGFGKYRMRTIGSCKIGVTCPAAMETTESPSGHINVIYYKTHLGHEQDVAHMKLTREERAQLAEKIEQGFSLDAILEDVKECTDMNSTKTRRMDLLSKKDLYSVMRTVNNNIIKRMKKKEEEEKRKQEEIAPQPELQPQPQLQPPPPSETAVYQQGPILIGTVENQENFQQNFTFYPAPSVVVPQEAVVVPQETVVMPQETVVVPQETVYLEPQPNFVTYQRVDTSPVSVPVPVSIPQVSGEGVASQVVILSPEMNYGSVAEIVLLSPEQAPPPPPPPPPTVTVFPQNHQVIQEPQPQPQSQPQLQPQPQPQLQPQPPPQPQPVIVNREPVRPVPTEPMTLEEKNKANRPNLRLQIQEKIDKILKLLPDSDSLTPRQFSLISAKLNRVLDIYTQVSAKAKLKKQPMKKRILKKVQYDGNWRNNAGLETRTTENAVYGRETVLQQPVYETPVLYAVYN